MLTLSFGIVCGREVSVLTVVGFFAFISHSNCQDIGSFYVIPGLNHTAYVQHGDINIGILTPIYKSQDDVDVQCDILDVGLSALQKLEAFAFAAELLNNNTNILPNVTIGFVILDECNFINTALAQSLSFLPRKADSCLKDVCASSSSPPSSATTTTSYQSLSFVDTSDDTAIGYYDVIGVISPSRSDRSVPISLLYSSAHVPLIAHAASSDELSDKSKHRYFMRVIPPDKYQVKAMISFIHERKWSYISVLYHEGPYGESALDNIMAMTSELGICVATSHKVGMGSDLEPVARSLLEFPKARVVILFTNAMVVSRLMENIRRLNATGHFVWIGSDAWAESYGFLTPYMNEIAGAFTFGHYSSSVQSFEEYFRGRKPSTSNNPWLEPVWETSVECSVANGTCDFSKDLPDIANGFSFANDISNPIDAFLTFGYAAHALLSDLCPNITGEDARKCVKGEIYLKYLLNTTFNGFSGNIQFDDNGDAQGKYEIQQILPERHHDGSLSGKLTAMRLALYDLRTNTIEAKENHVASWEFLNEIKRIVPLRNGETSEVPESVCSRPCHINEYKIQKKLICCWDCRTCRNNERLEHDSDADIPGCQECPPFMWPDPLTNFTTCESIPVSYTTYTDSVSLLLTCLAVIAIVLTLIVIAAFIHLRKAQIIKASSKELSFLQLVAILVGYITVICLHARPTHASCNALYFMFCLSFTWLYSPLLVKAIRIFRIFHHSSKFNRRPRFVSQMSQVIMATILIVFQVIICLSVALTQRPTSRLSQPMVTQKYVELSCDMTVPGMASFLAYNLILVSLCSIFAFKTRKLPDNFNESRFMSMCVFTTLLIWIAFIPTYLTATHEHVKVLLLSVALLVNHSVVLIFLFLPKIYAGIYLPPETGMMSRRLQNSLALVSSSHHRTNQVSPMES